MSGTAPVSPSPFKSILVTVSLLCCGPAAEGMLRGSWVAVAVGLGSTAIQPDTHLLRLQAA